MKRIITLLLSLALCLSLAACGGQTADPPTGPNDGQTGNTADDQTPEVDPLKPIETTCGTLYFPTAWSELLVTEESQSDDIDAVEFGAKVGENTYPLFKVMICDAEGDAVGVLTDQNGTARNVFVEVYDLGDLSTLEKETQDQIYAMQESVNTIIENLK